MKKLAIILFSAIGMAAFMVTSANAQVPEIEWNTRHVIPTYPASNVAQRSLFRLANGEYISGTSTSGAGGFIRWDSVGNVIETYTNHYSLPSAQRKPETNNIFNDIIKSQDTGFIALRPSSVIGTPDALIVKFSEDFDVISTVSFGGSGEDALSTIVATDDGGYILGGYTESHNGTLTGINTDTIATNRYAWVVKTDALFNIEWQKTYGGKKSLDTTPSTNFWLTYAGDRYQNVISIVPTSDNGYFLTLTTTIDNGVGVDTTFGESDIWAVKIDSTGNLLWGKVYGGSGLESPYGGVETSDGNYLIYGGSSSLDGMIHSQKTGGNGLWVLKINPNNGDTLWTKSIGGSGTENCWGKNSFYATDDGGVVIGSYTNTTDEDITLFGQTAKGTNANNDVWIFRLDANGEFVWNRVLGGNANEIEELGSILPADDGGVIVIARSNASNSGDVPANAPNYLGTGHGFWMFKLSSCPSYGQVPDVTICKGEVYSYGNHSITTAGIYYDSLTNSTGCDSLVKLIVHVDSIEQPVITANANILSTGNYNSYQWLDGNNNPINGANAQTYEAATAGDYRVVVTGDNGCSDTSVVYNHTPSFISEPALFLNMKLYPNPASDVINIEIPQLKGKATLELSSVDGRIIMDNVQLTTNNYQLSLADLSSGFYFIRIKTDEGTAIRKIIKE